MVEINTLVAHLNTFCFALLKDFKRHALLYLDLYFGHVLSVYLVSIARLVSGHHHLHRQTELSKNSITFSGILKMLGFWGFYENATFSVEFQWNGRIPPISIFFLFSSRDPRAQG